MLRLAMRWTRPLLVGAVVSAVVTYALLKPPAFRHDVSPVEAGVLYRAGQLEPEDLAQEIRHRGIKTVVNLGSRTTWDEQVCRDLGVCYLDLPVGDVWCLCGHPAPGQEHGPPAPFDIEPLWKVVEDPESRPVLIHCWGGVHRTGVVTALYRMRYQGWNADDAIREMDLFGFDSDKSKFDNVCDYLRAYRPDADPTLAKPAARPTPKMR